MARKKGLLGELLVERGIISAAQLEEALGEQARTKESLGRILINRRLVDESQIVATLAAQIGLQFVDLLEVAIDPIAVATLPTSLSQRYQAIPIAWDGSTLVVAMADPSNMVTIGDIRLVTGADIRVVVATRGAIDAVLARTQHLDDDSEDLTSMNLDIGDDVDDDLAGLQEITEDAPIVKLVNMLIRQAIADRASDIHIEPTETDVRIRYRIDGVLHEVMRTPKRAQAGLVSRLKIMADLNIAERRIPQDGRITAMIGGRQVDLRLATLPTVYGEKLVMRILDKGTALLDLADLGFLPETMARYETVFTKPYGTILVTGPTGSGKSTTLYATLNQLNDPAKNIVTVEDPVEYRLVGINQVQVNPKAVLSFAAALRSILRQDPDIVLVGEIRDRETAIIAMEAALTGHLVLSTLHTNDSCSTPTRLIEMGLEPYLVSSAVDCVVAQRLARRLCERCKEAYKPTAAEIRAMGWGDDIELPKQLFRPVGCGACSRTGYHGRFAIHEVMMVSEEIASLVAQRALSEEIKKIAIGQGMQTLRIAAEEQLRAGVTAVDEVLRVVS
ncbi:MAG: ATPase, T2SS/T4P/T4SS family [Acidimicrobiales bacterium]